MACGCADTDCNADPDCGLYGPCLQMQGGTCAGSLAPDTSCDPQDYAGAEVPDFADLGQGRRRVPTPQCCVSVTEILYNRIPEYSLDNNYKHYNNRRSRPDGGAETGGMGSIRTSPAVRKHCGDWEERWIG